MRPLSSAARSQLVFPSLRAFGDHVILRWAVDRLGVGQTIVILAGAHLKDLDAALGQGPPVVLLAHGEGDVPAVFDIRRRGVVRAVRSAARLRALIMRSSLDAPAQLVFDRLGWRERLISFPLTTVSLPVAPNIYLAYAAFFGAPAVSESASRVTERGHDVLIFPASRIAAKAIPPLLVAKVLQLAGQLGRRAEVCVLEDEAHPYQSAGLACRTLPKSFDAVYRTILTAGSVVAADSLPAHLAEYAGRPVFVLNRAPNPYWLPYSAHAGRRWSTFESFDSQQSELRGFLAEP